jgi:transketolase
MNGMALHKGLIPYGGTFLVFTDYCRPSIRLSAIMGQRVVYVMTHDSIGLGEDGPTHQPIEHLAALRAMPNVWTIRPADAVETLEAWQMALAREDGPSVLALTRQNLPTLRVDAVAENLSAKGGYVLRDAEGGERQVTLIATGSEVAIAVEARKLLAAEGIRAAVVSMPCTQAFDAQTAKYRKEVLGPARTPRIVVEAALGYGWEQYIDGKGAFVGMTGYGASAPAPDLYRHFGITAEAVAAAAKKAL